MAETSIQWTATPRADGTFAPGYTFNPWIGCSKVSAGCSHCYAEVQTYPRVSKARGLPLWGAAAARHVTSDANWREPVRWNRAAVDAGERRRVFCASLADVFEERDDLDEHRERLWDLIEATPALDWLLLTKRPEEILQRIPDGWRAGLPANVWVGTTVENQAMADVRIPHLLNVPARVRFLSCEPLLQRVMVPTRAMARISWCIIGGESGPKARPCAVEWVNNLLDECRAAAAGAGAAPFVKQLGDHVIWSGISLPGEHWPTGTQTVDRGGGLGFRVRLKAPAGGDPAEWPEDLRVREFPAGGAL